MIYLKCHATIVVDQVPTKLYENQLQKANRNSISCTARTVTNIHKKIAAYYFGKDQCDVCSYNVENISEGKVRPANKEVHIFTRDIQWVQLCPKFEASAIYQKTNKLCVHNFTMYNFQNQDVPCYQFDESTEGLVTM